MTDPQFQSQLTDQSLQFLMQGYPEVQKPLALTELAAASPQVEFPSPQFGFEGQAFIGQFGTMALT
ncbi:MAG: glucose dehydrogenase, partial [Thermoproteota archaeon]|nr:glucose dehydrogenase [Thermoproteota archaeon]